MGRTAGFCRYRHLFGEGPVVLRRAPPTTEKPFQWRNFESFFPGMSSTGELLVGTRRTGWWTEEEVWKEKIAGYLVFLRHHNHRHRNIAWLMDAMAV